MTLFYFLENKKILFSLFFYSLDNNNNIYIYIYIYIKRHQRIVVFSVFFSLFSPFPTSGFSSRMKQSKTFFFCLFRHTETFILFLFVLKSDFIFGMGCGNHFLVLLFEWDLSFFYSIKHFLFFDFSRLDAKKTGEREGKEFNKSKIFLVLFCSREWNIVFFHAFCS